MKCRRMGALLAVFALITTLISVRVSAAEVKRFEITPSEFALSVGDRMEMKAQIYWDDGSVTEEKVKWRSGNTDVVTIDGFGQVVAKGRGSCTIVAVYTDAAKNRHTASAEVSVNSLLVRTNSLTEAKLLDGVRSVPSGGSMILRYQNVNHITADTLKKGAEAAAKKNSSVRMQFDTLSSYSNDTQGRLSFRLADTGELTRIINPKVHTEASSLYHFENYFKNRYTNRFVPVYLEHSGSYGMTMRISADLPELKGLDTENLRFYLWDDETATSTGYVQIEAPAYEIDSEGILHFNTDSGGYIAVTDGPLVRKTTGE